MTTTPTPPRSLLLASFYQRMTTFGGLSQAMLSGASLSAELILRGEPEMRVLLDFTTTPMQVHIDDPTRSGLICMAADADILHQIMIGELNPGVAFARRQVLMRGSASNLARFMPLFAVSPLLYREHLADVGVEGFARPTGWAPLKEIVMAGKEFKGDPIPLGKRSRLEEMMFQRFNKSAYAMGYAMGMMRHRFLKNLSLFEMMAAMSRGMEAAASRNKRGES